jgi:hypothetical protein
MKRSIFLILISILIQYSTVCATETEWYNIKDINYEESFFDEEEQYLFEVKSYKLKNDYTLIIRPGIRKWNKGQEIYTKRYLIKNQTLIELPFEDNIQKFIGAKNYLFRYEGIDFKDYFCLTCFEGYDYYYLFNKITGKFEFKFRKTTVDINNEIIIFLDEKNDNDEMILYDLVTQKKYDLDNYITYGKYGSNTYWEDFKILKVTNSYYKVQFSGNYNEAGDVITQTFKVKK